VGSCSSTCNVEAFLKKNCYCILPSPRQEGQISGACDSNPFVKQFIVTSGVLSDSGFYPAPSLVKKEGDLHRCYRARMKILFKPASA